MGKNQPLKNYIEWLRQIYELVFDIDQKLAKVKDLLNEIDILKAQLETNVNVGKIWIQ